MALSESRIAAGSEEKEALSGITVDKYNVKAAEILASEAQCLPISEATPLYEQLLVTFPTAAKFWKQYVVAQMAANNEDFAKQIFSRCLLSCLEIPLWCSYIRFIKKINEKRGTEGLQETRKAYDFMLNYVGADIRSGPVWMEYINFLMSLPVSTTQEESQRMTGVRKAYQKAIITPTHHVEQLWKDYENFENSVSRALAKGLLSEYQSKSNSAKAVYREQKKYVDEINWDMLAVPPTGSYKEELQWIAWKRFLAFEKGNPQRIDCASSNKRIVFTYEQCLMYLYHFPDIWYDYATWHVKCGSFDAAAKVFQRSLKALPDSEMLKYSYAELEESRGAIQPAKKIYESVLGDSNNATALAHIQFIRFLRRNEGVEAARKHFLDARSSPLCTYHVYVAYAMMTFCLDKNPKIAHSVFESGLKRFMHEPVYILEYADFLTRLNDDRNVRALFERALSSLPAKDSIEVWTKFTQFEQTYGDLASMLKVEQRMKEALSRMSEEDALYGSLQDVVSRYSFKDLWPCSSKDLDHLAQQERLVRNMNKMRNNPTLPNVSAFTDKISSGPATTTNHTAKIIYPDTSAMLVCDPEHKSGVEQMQSTTTLPVSSTLSCPIDPPVISGKVDSLDDIRKATPPALISFLENLPDVEGPSPDADLVLSICLQSRIPMTSNQLSGGPSSCTSDLSGLCKPHLNPSDPAARLSSAKKTRKIKDEGEGRGGGESGSGQGMPLPRDVFRLRQLQKARGGATATSQTGSVSVSYGSTTASGELSGSTG